MKLRNDKVHLKKKLRRQESEYEKLKKEIGYDSPDVSDTSESEEESAGDDDDLDEFLHAKDV